MTIVKWTPENVVNMTRSELVKNAEMAGKYVEDDARRRLDAIKNPNTKRDNNYRRYLSKYILTNYVENKPTEVVIYVGMKVGTDGQTHHGFYIETGSSTAPAHPYLRPAVFQNGRNIVNILTGSK